MTTETRTCQNCKQEFVIEPQDFDFYKKIDVPPPTFCPDCRMQRRMMFRNERKLYRRNCDKCGKRIVSNISPDKPYVVYCGPCWWSDDWDALSFGQEYDSSRPFFEQFNELQCKVPFANLSTDFPTLVNSEYANHVGGLKNCYLTFDANNCENVHYGKTAQNTKDTLDCTIIGESELCSETINCGSSYRIFFCEDLSNCQDVYFSKDMDGCSYCIGCTGLRRKNYCFFNKQLSKEEWNAKFKELKLHSYPELIKFGEKAREFWLTCPRRFTRGGLNGPKVSGEYVFESKNALNCYQSRRLEDARYCQFLVDSPAKDLYDYTEWGRNSERVYECNGVGDGAYNLKFCYNAVRNLSNLEYCAGLYNSQYLFGCSGLRNKQYCILNRQYSREDFEKLRAKIISDMNERPYMDGKGRTWRYGEFYPYDISVFDYNESNASYYFPMSKEAVSERGFRYREPDAGADRMNAEPVSGMPDSIHDAKDDIVDKVFTCAKCKQPFRVIHPELELLRRFDLPLPRLCFECRYLRRHARLNPPKLWPRSCDCIGTSSINGAYMNAMLHPHGLIACDNAFETGYAPDRSEIVYCEQCYNAEVA